MQRRLEIFACGAEGVELYERTEEYFLLYLSEGAALLYEGVHDSAYKRGRGNRLEPRDLP